MKGFTSINRIMSVIAWLSVSLFSVQNVQAYSSFDGTATITYTIDSIVNTTGVVDDLTDFYVTGGFALDQGESTYIDVPLNSDGQATPFSSIADVYVDPVIGSFAKTMTVSGEVNDGELYVGYLGLFDLVFDNQSANDFDIQLSLNFDLMAEANGQNADSYIQLDYFNEAGDFNSGDGFSVFASTVDGSPASLNQSVNYHFTVASGDFDALYVDVGMGANLESSPVPVPAAFWFFGTALLIPTWRKFKLELVNR